MSIRRRGLKGQVEESADTPVLDKVPVEFISTGSILLNLAASQKGRDGGWARGRINNPVGDGSSGKTLLALEACAWTYYNILSVKPVLFPPVKEVKIIYNNVEGVMDFPVVRMYGQEFYDFVDWRQINICQQAGRDIQRELDNLKRGQFLLYVQDSIDATISAEEKERIDKSIKDDKEMEGSYKTEKAKYYSMSFFNDLCDRSKDKDATLMMISQVRENLNAGIFGKKYYRTGGKALDFYTHQVPWLYLIDKMHKIRRTRKLVYGVKVKAKYERNKTATPFREANFRILFDYGIDDIETMLDYAFGPKIDPIEWGDEKMKREDLVTLLENTPDQYETLIDIVETAWREDEEFIKPVRKRRFE